jgi:lipoate-protein ligase A
LTALASSSTDPAVNLALEESLLEGSRPEAGALLLYVDRPCVVIGRNQNPWIEVSASAGLPVFRRASGGGAVYHDEGNLNWSLTVPREAHDRLAELGLVVAALADLGIEAAADERGAIRIAGRGPLSGSKVSGSARRILRDRVLHHGTLLVDAKLAALSGCLGGIDAESSAAPASAPSRVANLAQAAPGLSVEDAAAALARAFAGGSAAPAERYRDAESCARAEARLGSWGWTFGATPRFSIAIGGAGGASSLEVRGGIVASATGPAARELDRLVGLRFDYTVPALAQDLATRCAK